MTLNPAAATVIAPKNDSFPFSKEGLPAGLTTDEAQRRLATSGRNAMPDTSVHPARMALIKFWAPVPWMLEAAVVLEISLGKYVEAAIIGALLLFKAALGFVQESRAQATLAAHAACRASLTRSPGAILASMFGYGYWVSGLMSKMRSESNRLRSEGV
jgi:H+-transporting ATPase